MHSALDLHELNNVKWLVLGFLVTESAWGPLVCIYLYIAQSYICLCCNVLNLHQYDGHAAQIYDSQKNSLFVGHQLRRSEPSL